MLRDLLGAVVWSAVLILLVPFVVFIVLRTRRQE